MLIYEVVLEDRGWHQDRPDETTKIEMWFTTTLSLAEEYIQKHCTEKSDPLESPENMNGGL